MAQLSDQGMTTPVPWANLEVDGSLADWNMPAKTWLAKNDKHWDGLATGAMVFNSEGRILLVQRASHDSMPNLWEMPGGAADDDDPSLPYAAARQLWEEAGLVAKRVCYIINDGPDKKPGYLFTNRTGKRFYCRFSFSVLVESCDHVKLDPNEHQDFVWASEDEVRSQTAGGKSIQIVNPETQALILEAFKLNDRAR
jgi:8-oxo-dGTP pyrophosphatase MutT (NUDIX family)